MNDVLMLIDNEWEDTHVKDYLRISGFSITELDIRKPDGFDRHLLHKDVVLIVCEHAGYYLSVCKKIRSYTEIPIVVITGTNDEWIRVKMYEHGADDYLTEPLHQIVLIAQLQTRIVQYKRLTRLYGYIQIRDLVIEVMNRRVFLKGRSLDLSIKEFDVLRYMVQHANEVVTREDIYSAVWKSTNEVGVNSSVPTYIKKLRKKIEDDPDNPQYLETIWGIGYRFVM